MSTLMTQARNRVPRFAEAAVERARLTVVARPVQKAPRVPFLSLVSLLLVTGVAGLLLFNTHMQQASFTATALQERASALDAHEQSLQMQLDTMRNPQKVAARAKRLGMVPASSPAFLRLSDGAVLGNPTVAKPEDAIRISPLPVRKPAELRPAPVIVELEKPKKTAKAAKAKAAKAKAADRAEKAKTRLAASGAPTRQDTEAPGRKNKQKSEQRQGSER